MPSVMIITDKTAEAPAGKNQTYVSIPQEIQQNTQYIIITTSYQYVNEDFELDWAQDVEIIEQNLDPDAGPMNAFPNMVVIQTQENGDVHVEAFDPSGFGITFTAENLVLDDNFTVSTDMSDWLKWNYIKCDELYKNGDYGLDRPQLPNLWSHWDNVILASEILNPNWSLTSHKIDNLNWQLSMHSQLENCLETFTLWDRRRYPILSASNSEPISTWRRTSELTNSYSYDWNIPGTYQFRLTSYIDDHPCDGWKSEGQIEIPIATGFQVKMIQTAIDEVWIHIKGQVDQDVRKITIHNQLGDELVFFYPSNHMDSDSGELSYYGSVTTGNIPLKSIKIELKYYGGSEITTHPIKGGVFYTTKCWSQWPLSIGVTEQVSLPGPSSISTSNGYLITVNWDPNIFPWYTPISAETSMNLNHSSAEWAAAIEDSLNLVKLRIIRHNGFDVVDMGAHYLNFYQSQSTDGYVELIGNSPYGQLVSAHSLKMQLTTVNPNNNQLMLWWQDNPAWRIFSGAPAGSDDSDDIWYEFRLESWSCGIQESLNSKEEYVYTADWPAPRTGTRAYSPWKKEHPIRTWGRYNPLRFNYIETDGLYPWCQQAPAVVLQRMANINDSSSLEPGILMPNDFDPIDTQSSSEDCYWRYIYSWSEENEILNLFPYYTWSFNVSPLARSEIQEIQVYVRPTTTNVSQWGDLSKQLLDVDLYRIKQGQETELELENNTNLGVFFGSWHPVEKPIEIVDFISYDWALEYLVKEFIDIFNASNAQNQNLDNFDADNPFGNDNSNTAYNGQFENTGAIMGYINNQMQTKWELKYTLKVIYNDGRSDDYFEHKAKMVLPTLPDQSSNISFQIGQGPPLVDLHDGSEDAPDIVSQQFQDWIETYLTSASE